MIVRAIRTAVVAGIVVGSSAAAQTKASTTADIAAIGKAGAEFSQRYMRGDAQGMADMYTQDGAIFPAGRPIIKGRADIEAYWTLPPNVKVVDHKTTADSIVVVGNTAYDYGIFRAVNSRDGQTGNPGYGKYVIVWQKQPDGRWLMYLDIWNNSPPPQP